VEPGERIVFRQNISSLRWNLLVL